jgi:hypothetical protein
MYRITNTRSMHRVVIRLSAMILVAALSLFATAVGSAAGSSWTVGKAAKRSARHKAKRPALAGVMFGGVTSTHAPVVIHVSRDGREVVEATMAVPCLFSLPVPGITLPVPNYYAHLSISATGAFQEKTERTESEAGQTATVTGRISGQFNRAMTSVTGTWSLAIVDHGATGAVEGQCDSGSVSFTAIQ